MVTITLCFGIKRIRIRLVLAAKCWCVTSCGCHQVLGLVGWGDASLPIPKDLSSPMRQLMSDCMEREPTQRPNFEEIIMALRSMRQAAKPEAPPTAAVPQPQQQEASQPAIDHCAPSRAGGLVTRRTL